MKKITVGVIGLGYWGPSYVRNFIAHEAVDVRWLCDFSETALNKIAHVYPYLKTTKNYHDILEDPLLDLVAIATPPETHFQIAKDTLLAKKHVVIAKPMTTNSKHAQKLLALAKKQKRMLHGDLTFLYTPAVKKIRELVKKGEKR